MAEGAGGEDPFEAEEARCLVSLLLYLHYNVFSIFDGQTQFLSVKGREQMLKQQRPRARPSPRPLA